MKIIFAITVLLSFSSAFAGNLASEVSTKKFCSLIVNDVDSFQLSCDGIEIESPTLKSADYLSFSAVSAELIESGLKLIFCMGDSNRGAPKLCGFARQ